MTSAKAVTVEEDGDTYGQQSQPKMTKWRLTLSSTLSRSLGVKEIKGTGLEEKRWFLGRSRCKVRKSRAA